MPERWSTNKHTLTLLRLLIVLSFDLCGHWSVSIARRQTEVFYPTTHTVHIERLSSPQRRTSFDITVHPFCIVLYDISRTIAKLRSIEFNYMVRWQRLTLQASLLNVNLNTIDLTGCRRGGFIDISHIIVYAPKCCAYEYMTERPYNRNRKIDLTKTRIVHKEMRWMKIPK